MYLEIDDGFLEHPKTLRLCRELGDHNASAYLLRLWTWATKSAPDGDLSELEPEDLEMPMRWRGEPGALYAALVRCRFIDELEGGVRQIHNWMSEDRTGGSMVRMEARAVAKRENDAKRQREYRERQREGQPPQPPDSHAPVTRDGDVTSRPKASQGKASQDETSPAQSDPPARDPWPPGTVAPSAAPPPVSAPTLALVQTPAPEARAPDLPGRAFTSYDLTAVFGRVREECVPGAISWQTPVSSQQRVRAQELCDRLTPETRAQLEPALRLFFGQLPSLAAADKRWRDVGFQFAGFLQRWQDLLEQLAGGRKDPVADKPCGFHQRGRNSDRPAPKMEASDRCAECRHVKARASPRQAGAPSGFSFAAMFDQEQRR